MKKTKDGALLIDPSVRLDDLEEIVDDAFEPGEYNTLAGLIYHHLGQVPEVGHRVELPGPEIVVEATDGHRLTEVRLTRLSSGEDTAS